MVEDLRKRAKWDNDYFIYRGHILNGMFDSLFDIYQYMEFAKDLWNFLEGNYMLKDATSKKFFMSCFYH